MGKSSVVNVVVDHYDTLRDARTQELRARDFLSQLGVPIVAAAALCMWPLHLRLHDYGQVVAGLAIFGGFMFGLVAYVFQLRVSVANDPRVEHSGRPTLTLLDELFSNLSYAVLVCLGGSLIAVVSATALPTLAPTSPWQIGAAHAVASSTMIFLLAHTWMVIAMCMKRTRAAYQELRR